ncbi:MAG: hypothetical protein RJB25_1461, partial [Bacteroidota bacterium]
MKKIILPLSMLLAAQLQAQTP